MTDQMNTNNIDKSMEPLTIAPATKKTNTKKRADDKCSIVALNNLKKVHESKKLAEKKLVPDIELQSSDESSDVEFPFIIIKGKKNIEPNHTSYLNDAYKYKTKLEKLLMERKIKKHFKKEQKKKQQEELSAQLAEVKRILENNSAKENSVVDNILKKKYVQLFDDD